MTEKELRETVVEVMVRATAGMSSCRKQGRENELIIGRTKRLQRGRKPASRKQEFEG